MTSLPPLSAPFADTRRDLHRVAVHILARRRAAVTGRIGLRSAPAGIATPAFGDDLEVLRTSGGLLIVERAGTARAVRMTTLRQLAAFAGVDVASPLSVGRDTPLVGDVDAPLRIDGRAAHQLAGWLALVAAALDEVVAAVEPGATPSVTQLWPEHFDVACDVAWGAADGERANLGGSPGDGYEPAPYAYVGPWGSQRPGDPGFWNAPFGAVLSYSGLLTAKDRDDARAMLVGFFLRGLMLLATG